MTTQTPELTTVDLLSAALDEVYALRTALAFEARVVEAHYEGYKTFPKTRRRIAEEQVDRMRCGVMSASKAYAGISSLSLRQERRRCGFGTLTRYQWETEVAERRAAVRVVVETPNTQPDKETP